MVKTTTSKFKRFAAAFLTAALLAGTATVVHAETANAATKTASIHCHVYGPMVPYNGKLKLGVLVNKTIPKGGLTVNQSLGGTKINLKITNATFAGKKIDKADITFGTRAAYNYGCTGYAGTKSSSAGMKLVPSF